MSTVALTIAIASTGLDTWVGDIVVYDQTGAVLSRYPVELPPNDIRIIVVRVQTYGICVAVEENGKEVYKVCEPARRVLELQPFMREKT